jgi:hypothetical protein
VLVVVVQALGIPPQLQELQILVVAVAVAQIKIATSMARQVALVL